MVNDIATLSELFWDSPLIFCYGATENLYGAAEIEAFRKKRLYAGLAQDVVCRKIVTFGTDIRAVKLEFNRNKG